MLKRALWLWLSAIFLLVGTALFAAGDGTSPVPEGITPDAGTSASLMRDGGGEPPTDPATIMESAVNIYIQVVLRQPPGLPPPHITITNLDCTPGSEFIYTKSWSGGPASLGGIRFNIYREKAPMWYITDCDSSTNLIGNSTTNTFIDQFTDPFWGTYGSKGTCDTTVNYYYVWTTVDSLPDGTTNESPYPTGQVAEYDQVMIQGTGGGFFNILSYPVSVYKAVPESPGDTIINTAKEIGELIGADIQYIYKWGVGVQQWVQVARRISSTLWLATSADSIIDPGYVFGVNLTSTSDTVMWSTYTPGYVPDDHSNVLNMAPGYTYTLHWIMLPFRRTYELMHSESTYPDPMSVKYVGADIPTASYIYKWDPAFQQSVLKARNLGSIWIDVGGALPAIPGHVIGVSVSDSTNWPVGS